MDSNVDFALRTFGGKARLYFEDHIFHGPRVRRIQNFSLPLPCCPWKLAFHPFKALISDSSVKGLPSVFAASFCTAKELASAQCLLFIEFYFHCPLLDSTLLILLFSTFPWILFVEHHVLGSRKAPGLKESFSILTGTLISCDADSAPE